MLSVPTSTAPAASRRSTSVASRDAGGRSRLIFDPASVGSPSTSNRFFTAKGTPASGPAAVPALRSARCSSTAVKALIDPFRARIVSSAEVTHAKVAIPGPFRGSARARPPASAARSLRPSAAGRSRTRRRRPKAEAARCARPPAHSRRRSSSSLQSLERFHVVAPAAELRDVSRAGDGVFLAEKTLHPLAVLELDRSDRERRGNSRDKRAEVACGHFPYFHFDARPSSPVRDSRDRKSVV